MKPGDMIEWVYTRNNKPVIPEEELWSTTMKRYVPIDGYAFLISLTDETYTWLNEKGLFHARVDDADERAWRGVGPRRLFHARVDDIFGCGHHDREESCVIQRAKI